MPLPGGHEFTLFPLASFSDTTANDELARLKNELLNAKPDNAELKKKWLSKAKSNRSTGGRSEALESACMYLLLAQDLVDPSPKSDPAVAAKYFHFAANELRQIDLLARAAQCYFNSALQASDATASVTQLTDADLETLVLGLRSAGRAKSTLSDLGEDEQADQAHALRLDIKRRMVRLEGNRFLHAVLAIWGGLTRYGTSPVRWSSTVSIAFIGFSILYLFLTGDTSDPNHLLPAIRLLDGLGNNSLLTGPFLAFVNMLSFGAYTNIVPQNWLGELVILAHACTAFLLIGTGATFLTRR